MESEMEERMKREGSSCPGCTWVEPAILGLGLPGLLSVPTFGHLARIFSARFILGPLLETVLGLFRTMFWPMDLWPARLEMTLSYTFFHFN